MGQYRVIFNACIYSIWRASEVSETLSGTLSGVTQLKNWGPSFAFLCLLHGLPLPIPPPNRILPFSDPVSFKEI